MVNRKEIIKPKERALPLDIYIYIYIYIYIWVCGSLCEMSLGQIDRINKRLRRNRISYTFQGKLRSWFTITIM